MYGSGAWREDSGKVIAEAGMILRDPSALHLIIQQVPQLLTQLPCQLPQQLLLPMQTDTFSRADAFVLWTLKT